MILIEHLNVDFGGVRALDDLSLEVESDVTGIIGPNGAGKTTLINVLSGFVHPSAGRILAHDHDLLAMKPHERARWGLARSFQKAQIVDDLSIMENVQVALDFQRLSSTDKKQVSARVLDFTGLAAVRNRRGRALNAHQRRLTEIARCLASSPKIVLLDEPGGGLSEAETVELRHLISNIRSEFGAMVILIDHDVELIRAVCSKTAVLDFGKLIGFDKTETVLRDDKVKAAYLGN